MSEFIVGDRVLFHHPSLSYIGTIQAIQSSGGIIILTEDRKCHQTSTKYLKKLEGESAMAKKKKKVEKPSSIVITITVPDLLLGKATIMAERGDLAYMHSVDYVEGQTDWNAVVADARAKLIETEISPPKAIKTSKDDVYDPNAPKYSGYADWEAENTDMPWADYEAKFVDASEPIINGESDADRKLAVASLAAKHLVNCKPSLKVVEKEDVPAKTISIKPEKKPASKQKAMF